MKRIIIEADKCDGCKNCSLACMQAHQKKADSLYTVDLTDVNNETRNFIYNDRKNPGKYVPIFCRHCDEPECALSCMSGALRKDPKSGHVLYDSEKCGSCFMCVMNCPYGVLKPDDATHTKVIKCDFCKDSGGEPSCVKACPKQAIHVEEV